MILSAANLTGGKGVDFMQEIPVPKISLEEQKCFIDLAKAVISAQKERGNSTTEEARIDALFYTLYGFTAVEISEIEKC
jgi:hypothetical protein